METISTREYAIELDRHDQLRHIRSEFIIPSKSDLKRKTLTGVSTKRTSGTADGPCVYLCGNSLGLQPRRTSERISSHLSAWATKGVLGHYFEHEDTPLPPFLHADDVAAEKMASLVGASKSEVAVMGTLTANLHVLMASFYRPTKEKFKIILEGKAFPSDHYAIESQIRNHGFKPREGMIIIEHLDTSHTLTTSQIISTIDANVDSTALILLPGIQYYTGQYFDIKTITEHAHAKGVNIGWDLAHAVGNVDVQLHDWDVDFAAWCNYKYVNAGPGAIAGLFVHEKHGQVDMQAEERGKYGFRPRLTGWWGADKATRFVMGNRFIPIPGAAGYQVSNPSALDITALLASLEIFAETNMSALRDKSQRLTSYLENLLLHTPSASQNPYHIITPSNPHERGAQLSIKLNPGLLEGVLAELEAQSVVVDERKPDVIRVAPAPLYNTFEEVWLFVDIFRKSCEKVKGGSGGESVMLDGGKEDRGWEQIK